MNNLKACETTEAEHFKNLLESTGGTWWGNKTVVGQYRQDLRARLAIDFFKPASEELILDLGCGVGIFTVRLAKANCKVLGIDITPASIEYAKKIYSADNISYEVGSAYELPLEDNSVNYVTGNAVLHHFDLEEALPEIFRVLTPGGKLIFFEPNMLNPQIFIEKNIKIVGKILQNTQDETAFYKNNIKNCLLENGFKQVIVQPFDFMHPIVPGIFLKPLKTINFILERVPLIREFAGSLIIKGLKP